jgi:PAS domain S-box-containing protein
VNDLEEETIEDLFEHAPCGYVLARPDGTIVRVNRTFEDQTGRDREDLIGRRFSELLSTGGRIYHETHYAPLLAMQGEVRGIAVEIVRAGGSRLPALISSTLRRDEADRPAMIRTAVFDASDRRRYEQELLDSRRQEREVARELQRSLLSGKMPDLDAVEFDVLYRPSVAHEEVGGDWYDAFCVAEDTVSLVVGDVVGRGMSAAATMGQLRSAIRALATAHLGPSALLETLDEYVARHDVGFMTTLVYGQLDLASGVLRYSVAGHPPPAVVDADGRARFLEEGRSVPLNALPAGRARPEAAETLMPGACLVLYTDGLVERRSRSIDEGLSGLLAELRDPAPLSLDGLVGRLVDVDQTDDVCVMSARYAG